MNNERKKTARGTILTLIKSLQPGECFFVDCEAKEVQRYASAIYYKKVSTQVIISLNPKTLQTEKILKVTIL